LTQRIKVTNGREKEKQLCEKLLQCYIYTPVMTGKFRGGVGEGGERVESEVWGRAD